MSVRNEQTFLTLARSLPHVIGPSLKTFVVGDQALRIKSTNDWWQMGIDMCMHSVDLIVMDVSDVGQGSTWEILQLSKRGLEDKCLFICQEGYDQRGLNSLRQLNREFDPGRLHVYPARGLLKELSGFESELRKLVAQALNYRQSRETSNQGRIADTDVSKLSGVTADDRKASRSHRSDDEAIGGRA